MTVALVLPERHNHNRLPFVLPEWTRVAWASARAREVWEPRIAAVSRAWEAIERFAVADDAKASCLQNVAPADLPAAVAEASKLGIVALPMGRVGAGGSYSAASRPVGDGPWVYRVVYTRPDLAAEWGDAWARSDDEAIGRLLGFPACCRKFFKRFWNDERMVDLTWPAFENSRVTLSYEVDGPPEANILGRWMGVRLVSHMPCSFNCESSIAIGNLMTRVGIDRGFVDEMRWVEEILSWPAEWTALHGIAEIKTPIYRVSTRTDATAKKLTVRFRGTRYPEEGASGTTFPFQTRATVIPLTSLRSYRKAFDDSSEWTDNGFSSRDAMEAAHAVVGSVAPTHPVNVLDLGCGNGRLARRVAGAGHVRGVDVKRPKGKDYCDQFVVADIRHVTDWAGFDANGRRDLILLMPGRLIEMGEGEAAAVRRALRGRQVLAYAYGDWLSRFGGLFNLLVASGLSYRPITSVDIAGEDAAAMFIEVN